MLDSCIKIVEGIEIDPNTRPILVFLKQTRSAAYNAKQIRALPRVE